MIIQKLKYKIFIFFAFLPIFNFAQSKIDYFKYLINAENSIVNQDNDNAILYLRKAIADNPQSSASNYLLAKLYESEDNNTLALNYAENAYDIDTSNYWYKMLLFKIYNALYDKANSIKYLNLILKNTQRKSDFLFAIDYVDSIGDNQDLFKFINCYKSKFGTDKYYFDKLINYYNSNKDTLLAVSTADKFFKTNKQTNYSLFLLLRTFINFNYFDSTNKYINLFSYRLKNNFDYNLLIAEYYYKKYFFVGDSLLVDSSYNYLVNAINSDLTDISKIDFFLNSNFKLFNPIILEDKFDSLASILLDRFPDSQQIILFLAQTYQKYNRFYDALDFYQKYLKLNYSNFDYYYKTFALLNRLEDWNDLDSLTNAALQFFPMTPELFLFRGIALLNLNFLDEAFSNLDYGLNITYNNNYLKSNFYFYLSEYYRLTKNNLLSQNTYNTAIELAQNSSDLLSNFAFYYARTNINIDTALNLMSKAVLQNPDDLSASTAYIYAFVLYRIDDLKSALNYVNQAIDSTKYPNFFYFLLKSKILNKLGDTTNAYKFFEKSIYYGYENDE